MVSYLLRIPILFIIIFLTINIDIRFINDFLQKVEAENKYSHFFSFFFSA